MTSGLDPVAAELDRWRQDGRTLPVWWRDDDAIQPTPALDRLLALAERVPAPIHLAVIPQAASASLADGVLGSRGVFVLTHGWSHRNHAPSGQKKAEFGAHRPIEDMRHEIEAGRQTIHSLFGERALPIFVPPWNRIAPEVVAELAQAGFSAVSAFSPRATRFAAPELLQVNTHLDPIDWHGGGGLIDAARLGAQISNDLRDRREGRADNAEPYGLLTHHLVHDEAIWTFVESYLEMMSESRSVRWVSPLAEE